MDVSHAKRLKELESENARLKRIVADQVLGMEILQEALEKSCEPGTQTAGGRGIFTPWSLFRAGSLPLLSLASKHPALRCKRTGCLDETAAFGRAATLGAVQRVGV